MSEIANPDSARFAFGENWKRFLDVLNDDRIRMAEDSLRNMLGVENLEGRSFLDIGSGSGLFSLAAMRLGASRVHSFDYDVSSVACTQELRRRYFPEDPRWVIERGDVLNDAYLSSLGTWDVVYSWGVLHHTGDMWAAFTNVAKLGGPGSHLYISIYNDQGKTSRRWTRVKQVYNAHPAGRATILGTFVPLFAARQFATDLLHRRSPLTVYREYSRDRGMSRVHDWVDWLGGYPFEVAKPEEVFEHFQERDFTLERLKTCAGGLGCNEFLFRKLQ